jgi:HEPN domain-containing protein
MTPHSRKFPKSYAKTLFRIAEGDFQTAKILLKYPGGRVENSLFHIQQAMEKALKALLCHHKLPIPMTHDLGALLGALPDKLPALPQGSNLTAFTEFATVRRYEEAIYELDSKELEAALRLGESVLLWAKQILSEKNK